jgi:hypothetical protein
MSHHDRQLAPGLAPRALAWVCMVIVISITTYGLNLFATALAPTASAVSGAQTTIESVQDNPALLDDAILVSSLVDQSAPRRVVTIIGRDVVTGERQQLQCSIAADRTASDVLVVDFNHFPDVISGLCE